MEKVGKYFKHGADMLQVGGTEERSLSVAHSFHQGFSCLSHLLHFHIIQQSSLFLTSYTCQQSRALFIKWPAQKCTLLEVFIYKN